MDHQSGCKLFAAWLVFSVPFVIGTYRYYSGYLAYGTGDTIIQTWHNHGGTRLANRKWVVECMDGEALIGIQDWNDDFSKLQTVWCKFIFPYKPPSQGLYPYYPSCYVLNYLTQWFCYNAQNSSQTMNTFITGLWDNEYNWWVYRAGGFGLFSGDDLQPFKCCKVPLGYYIDYISCYYEPTHDVFFEYYDATFHYMVYCGTGYVMTGITKKVNPYTKEFQIDWIQCCRVGFGERTHVSPPILQVGNGRPTYVAQYNVQPTTVPAAYRSQYKITERGIPEEIGLENSVINNSPKLTKNRDERLSKSSPSERSKRDCGAPSSMHSVKDFRDFSGRSSL